MLALMVCLFVVLKRSRAKMIKSVTPNFGLTLSIPSMDKIHFYSKL